MATFAQQLKDSFFYLLDRVKGCSNSNSHAKGTTDAEKSQMRSVQGSGVLEVRERGPTLPSVKKPPPSQTN